MKKEEIIKEIIKNLKSINEKSIIISETNRSLSFMNDTTGFNMTIEGDLFMFGIVNVINNNIIFSDAIPLKYFNSENLIPILYGVTKKFKDVYKQS